MEEKKIARFAYVEPNNLYANGPDNAIQYNPEDYNISVNLEVEIPDRMSCGGAGKKIYASSDNGTITFFGGTGGGEDKQGFLTTSFTDISSSNVGRGNKETLGIESIHISYQQWFYPIVTIKFVDVRGASLFMPQENAFQDTLKRKEGDITQVDSGSFFKAIFACPSPIFKLTVKGFYGNPIQYKLKMQKFSTDFDSVNGNFVANVDFIGYMYGVYTEIPFIYCAIAPFINGKESYWDVQVNNGRFLYNNSQTPILTFPDFHNELEIAMKRASKMRTETEQSINYKSVNEDIGQLQMLANEFPLKDWFVLSGSNGETYFKVVYEPIGKCGLTKEEIESFKTYYNKLNNLNINFKEFKTCGKVFDIESTDKLKYLKYQIDKDKKVYFGDAIKTNNGSFTPLSSSYDVENLMMANQQTETKLFEEINDKFINESNGEKVIENRYKNLGANQIICVYVIDTNLLKFINQSIESYNKQKENIDKELDKQQLVDTNNLLGFDLTVGNIFKMIFAHIETFMHYYYQCCGNIKTQLDGNDVKRSLSHFGVTDVSKHWTGGTPPFPLVLSEEEQIEDAPRRRVILPPSDCEEIKFTKAILAAAHQFEDTYKTNDIEREQIISEIMNQNDDSNMVSTTDNFVPLTPFDFVDNKGGYNPYKIETNDENYFASVVATIFVLRCYMAFCYYGNVNEKTAQQIANIEAINLWKANKNLSEETKTLLKHKVKNFFNSFTKYNSNNVWNLNDTPNNVMFKDKINGNIFNYYNWIVSDSTKAIPLYYDLNGIKTDVANGSFLDSEKYLKVDENGKLDGKFVIFNDEYYYRDFLNNVKNDEVFNILQLKEKDDTLKIYGDTKANDLLDSNYISSPCFPVVQVYEKDKEFHFVGITPIIDSTNWYEILKRHIEQGDKYIFAANYNKKLYSGAKKLPTLESVSKNICSIGRYNNDDAPNILNCPEMNIQEDMKSKAYIFLFSLPIWDKYISETQKAKQLSVFKFSLLKEGAHYWRERTILDEEFDPVILNYPGSGDTSYIPVLKKGNDFKSFYIDSAKNKKKDYFTWEECYKPKSDISQTRKDTLIKYFEDWVESNTGFKKIYEKNETNKDEETIKYDLQEDLVNFLMEKVYFIDYTKTEESKKLANLPTMVDKSYELFINKCFNDTYHLFGNKVDNNAIENGEISDAMGLTKAEDIELSTYLVLKDMYDKFLSSQSFENFQIGNPKSEFNNFSFIDSYYNDISERLLVNGSLVSEMIRYYNTNQASTNIDERFNKQMSIFEFMSEILQKNMMTFLSLPQKLGVTKPNEVAEMFTPQPFPSYIYKDGYFDSGNFAGHYIGLYSYRPSEHLDIIERDGDGLYAYDNDGFDIADILGNESNVIPMNLNGVTKFGYIPSFGVTYAKQNQSYFKNINLTTENQQVTEHSIVATMDIATRNSDSSGYEKQSTLYGQDLYRVYSNYSYQCSVEMMGNAQVMPLMYFQLNNIPMWRGAYMIISVEHNIVAGDMTTKFTGVRVNKNAMPFTSGDYFFTMNDGKTVSIDKDGVRQVEFNYNTVFLNGVEITGNARNEISPKSETENITEKELTNIACTKYFSMCNEDQGKCAKGTYKFANLYVNGGNVTVDCKSGGKGNAWDEVFLTNIKKLGYTIIKQVITTGKEVQKYVNNSNNFQYADVVVYVGYDSKGNIAVKENGSKVGHAQYYKGDAYKGNAYKTNKFSLWGTDNPNNYGSAFVYGKYVDKDWKWKLVHLGAPKVKKA